VDTGRIINNNNDDNNKYNNNTSKYNVYGVVIMVWPLRINSINVNSAMLPLILRPSQPT